MMSKTYDSVEEGLEALKRLCKARHDFEATFLVTEKTLTKEQLNKLESIFNEP